MDRFRIMVLEKLLSNGGLNPEQRNAVLTELEKKCRVFSDGCFKRGKVEEGKEYTKIPLKYMEDKLISNDKAQSSNEIRSSNY